MPCHNDAPSVERVNRYDTDAMLCALFKVNEAHMLLLTEAINEKEAGITKEQVRAWWAEHQRKDLARRKLEEEKAMHRKLVIQGLSKLTPEERKALGLK